MFVLAAPFEMGFLDAAWIVPQPRLVVTNVCPHCFRDEGLKKRIIGIRPDFADEKCHFHPRFKGIPAAEVAKIVDPIFRSQYSWGDYNSYNGEQRGDPLDHLIGEITLAEDDLASKAVSDALIEDEICWPQDGEEPFYASDQNYVRHDHVFDHHGNLWDTFVRSISHDQRFFNTRARELIAEIFDGLQYQRDNARRSPIYRIEPGTPEATFFRARQANSDGDIDRIQKMPHKELGPPPKRQRRPGRMNPAGIGCFYGAYELSTCVAELRPIVGSVVIGAKFDLTRPIYVLDTTRFEAPMRPLSVFSKDYLKRVEQWSFMNTFAREIARPISPSDEHLDYIPTQAVAEYFLHHHSFKRDGLPAKIEGIIFQSAQLPPNKNIVLLGDAALVHGPAPSKSKRSPLDADPFSDAFMSVLEQIHSYNPALSLSADPVEVLRVTSARFTSESYLRRSALRSSDF